LLTNDDGINADGLQALRRALTRARDIKVYTVAPDRERSGSGHAVTFHRPIMVEECDLPGGGKGWAVAGTPADCAKLGCRAILAEPPDLILSGVNRGPNLATDVFYSGTVSAAIEGAIMGIPSIAVSLCEYEAPDFEYAARSAVRLARLVHHRGLPTRSLLNVNIPAVAPEHIAGVRVTRLGIGRWREYFDKRVDERGRILYQLLGERLTEKEAPDTDLEAVRAGYVSVSPIHLDMTLLPLMTDMGGWPELQTLGRPGEGRPDDGD